MKRKKRRNQRHLANAPFPWPFLLLLLAVIEVVRYTITLVSLFQICSTYRVGFTVSSLSLPTHFFYIVHSLYCQPRLPHTLRGENNYYTNNQVHISPPLDIANQRRNRKLSIDLGGGNCKWTLPTYDIDEELDFHKTLIAGFPSGDKRMIFLQMEALTGLRKFFGHVQ